MKIAVATAGGRRIVDLDRIETAIDDLETAHREALIDLVNHRPLEASRRVIAARENLEHQIARVLRREAAR